MLAEALRRRILSMELAPGAVVDTPFGGYKESGFGGPDKSIWAHDQYMELKTIWINAS